MKPLAPIKGIMSVGLAVLLGSSGGLGLVIPAPASADALPNSPSNLTATDRWINPDLRLGENTQGFRLELTDVPAHIPLDGELQLKLTVSNDSNEPLTGFSVVPQHGTAANSVSEARAALHQTEDTFGHVGGSLESTEVIQPGQSRELTLTVTTAVGANNSFNIAEAGVYPVLIGLRDATNHSVLSTQRFLLSVGDFPTTNTQATTENSAENNTEAATVSGMTVLYPLSATVDILGGETGEAPNPSPLILRNDNLAPQLAKGGRLANLLTDYKTAITDSSRLNQATCLALDPQLVDTVARMAQGYSVSQERPSTVSQKRRLRDSWTFRSEKVPGHAGSGTEAAQQWLAELEETAQKSSCVVALPWANADLNAVAQMQDSWLMREAIQHGNQVLREVLGISPMNNVVIPGSGYVTETTANTLGWAGDHNTDISASWDANQQATRSGQEAIEADLGDTSVSVLVADNTVWNIPQTGRFGQLAPQIRSVTYPGSLAASLAEATDDPTTVGYGNYAVRYDYRLDSTAARHATATSAIRLSVAHHNAEGGDPLLVQLPALMSDSSQWLATMTEVLDSGTARPQSLQEYLSINITQLAELRAQSDLRTTPESTAFGAPYDDPTVVSDLEILQAQRQLESVNTLTELVIKDPAIALTPYGFTAPLRRDILRAVTCNERGAISTYDSHVDATRSLLNNNYGVLTQLRHSVALLPPGNVYTRISSSSPLPIVAQNGLPLPVDTQIQYSGPHNATIAVPAPIIIPAKGSITINMTADLPKENSQRRTDLNLWLSTSNDAPFSDSVTIGVRTRSGIASGYGVATILLILLTIALSARIYIRRRRNSSSP